MTEEFNLNDKYDWESDDQFVVRKVFEVLHARGYTLFEENIVKATMHVMRNTKFLRQV